MEDVGFGLMFRKETRSLRASLLFYHNYISSVSKTLYCRSCCLGFLFHRNAFVFKVVVSELLVCRGTFLPTSGFFCSCRFLELRLMYLYYMYQSYMYVKKHLYSHTSHLLPHRLLLRLTWGIRSLEGIIISPYPGGL